MASKAKDDVYKDDFSSDEEDKSSARVKPDSKAVAANHMGWIEAAELVFENSIRDNF